MITILFVSIAVLALGFGLITGILLWKQKELKLEMREHYENVNKNASYTTKTIIEYVDRAVERTSGELNKGIENGLPYLIKAELTSFKAQLINEASTRLVNGKPFLVPDCVIEAREKGYLKKGFEFELGGTVYKFCDIQLASDRELIITTETISKALFGQTKHAPITIYKDGLWLELKPVTEKKSLRDINIK